jgi:hypothetical protein
VTDLSAALTNLDGTSNVYITDDPTVNGLTLTITNGLGRPVVMPPGKPLPFGELPDGQSAVYIFPNALIDNDDIAKMSLTASGWTATSFTDPSTELRYLVIAPEQQVTIQPGGVLTFGLTNVLVSGSPRSSNADLTLAGATGVDPDEGTFSLYITIANPPHPGKKALDLTIGFATPAVYTGQPQSLTLYLVNPHQTPLVPGGTADWGNLTPTFQLTLVYGAGAGAISPQQDANLIHMNISNEYGNVWKAVSPQDQGTSPYWLMRPDPNGGGTVLGTGEQATIEFAITGIQATLPAGLDRAITLAYVSWWDIPGYNDDSTTLIITKYPGPRVLSFTADPPSVKFGDTSVQTVLTWDTEHTTGVRFQAPQIGPSETFDSSGSGPRPGGINAAMGTKITLLAYKQLPAKHRKPQRRGKGHEPKPAADPAITAQASLVIHGVTRTEVSAGIDSLAMIVFPPGRPSAVLFQGILGTNLSWPRTKAAIMDLPSHAITGTLDLAPLLPSEFRTAIIDAAASPDGKTIHVLVEQDDLSRDEVQFSLARLQVAGATYDEPVSLGSLGPAGQTIGASILAAPDGRTIYACAQQIGATPMIWVHALNAANYSVTGSWSMSNPLDQVGWPDVVAVGPDGGVLLLASWTGLMTVDLRAGGTRLAALDTGIATVRPWMVSADGGRVYGVGDVRGQANARSAVSCAVDLKTGALSLVDKIGLDPAPSGSGQNPSALSSDGRTLYTWDGHPDILTTLDTTTFARTDHTCGLSGTFKPLLIAAVPQSPIVMCSGSDGQTNGTVEILTVY